MSDLKPSQVLNHEDYLEYLQCVKDEQKLMNYTWVYNSIMKLPKIDLNKIAEVCGVDLQDKKKKYLVGAELTRYIQKNCQPAIIRGVLEIRGRIYKKLTSEKLISYLYTYLEDDEESEPEDELIYDSVEDMFHLYRGGGYDSDFDNDNQDSYAIDWYESQL